MRYWWVNQNQTYRHEVSGGYLWSPKLKANGARNPFYDFMREVAPGDAVFSFAGTYIKAIGIVRSHAYEAPKPEEFGSAGKTWNRIGWRVDVLFFELHGAIRPANHMEVIAPLLPDRYAPLSTTGGGLQVIYLTRLPERLAEALVDLIGREARDILTGGLAENLDNLPDQGLGQVQWEERELELLRDNLDLSTTEREAVVIARRGQGIFKRNVMKLEGHCRITKVNRPEHLRASHCKPWRDSSNSERLDGENGLLLTPNADHLFDRGFISFWDNGDVILSPVAHKESLAKLGIDLSPTLNVGGFSDGQQKYLNFHRESVLLRSTFLESSPP